MRQSTETALMPCPATPNYYGEGILNPLAGVSFSLVRQYYPIPLLSFITENGPYPSYYVVVFTVS